MIWTNPTGAKGKGKVEPKGSIRDDPKLIALADRPELSSGQLYPRVGARAGKSQAWTG